MSLPTVASVVSSGLGAYPTIFYEREGLDALRSRLFLYGACEQRNMPLKAGVATQIWDNSAMSANTSAATEGQPGSGQALTENVRTITLSQYVDYLSYSDKAVLTHINDVVINGTRELAYRGALSVDTVISTALDTAANSDSATRIEINDGSYMTASISRRAAYGLRAVNVLPKANGYFFGVIPSVMAFDMVNDSTAGGFIDLTKYDSKTSDLNLSGVGQNAGARLGVIGGVEWFESNALPTETNWQSSAHSAYHAYVIGWEALITAGLAAKTDLGQKNFAVKVLKFTEGNSIDPGNVIAGASAYNFFFGVSKRTGSTNGFRRIRSESSIG
jgi:N4-gp56 family major capsid protein